MQHASLQNRPLVATPTKLTTYQRCPLQYRLRYVDRIQVDEGFSRPLETANATHAVLSQAFSQFAYNRAMPVNIRDRIDAVLLQSDYPDSQTWDEDVEKVERWVHAGLHWSDGRANILDIEQDFSRFVPRSGDHPEFVLRARIDLLLERDAEMLEIVDFKTGNSTFVDTIQNTITRILVSKRFPGRPVRNTVVFLQTGKVYSEIIDREALFEVAAEIKRLVHAISTEVEWSPEMNPLCDYCPFSDRCPLFGSGPDGTICDLLDDVA